MTCLVNRAGGQHEVMKSVLEVGSLARSATPEENQRVVPACRQHSSVSRLRRRVDVWWHVLALATSEHVRNLKEDSRCFLFASSDATDVRQTLTNPIRY